MTGRPFRWWIVLFRVAGVVLVLAGLAEGYFWFYKMGPCQKYSDPAWCSRHSESARWKEFEKSIRRGVWTHDTGFMVGDFGDKAWAEWVFDRLQPGDDLGCFGKHFGAALTRITNQDAGDASAWLAWWKENRPKSQEDWIREGFRKYGLELQTPLTRANIVALLKMAAPPLDNEESKIPSYVRFNALRWLRDSDFDPLTFTFKDVPSKDGDDVLRGLVCCAYRTGQNPKQNGLGVLRLGKPLEGDSYSWEIPELLTWPFQIKIHAKIFAPLGLGLLLLWLTFQRGKKKRQEVAQSILE